MIINSLLSDNNMSVYQLAKRSGVPYTTVNDICNGNTKLLKCNAETVYKIAKVLDVSIESLLDSEMVERCSFDLFKSNVCHDLKRKGDIDFLVDILEQNVIMDYYDKKWYPECLYLLAMIDYISRLNNVPICQEYDEIRKLKLNKPLYPSSLVALSLIDKQNYEISIEESIPEFARFNIIENDIRNVV